MIPASSRRHSEIGINVPRTPTAESLRCTGLRGNRRSANAHLRPGIFLINPVLQHPFLYVDLWVLQNR